MKSLPKKWIVIAAIVLILLLLTGEAARAAGSVSSGLDTAGSRSFLGQSNLPRGIRNNNPGNLRRTNPPQGWQGALPAAENTDGAFEQFRTYAYGLRAMLKLLRNKIAGGHNTIRKLIYEWAPPIENNTEAYVAAVERETGIGQNMPIGTTDKSKLFLLAQAIERHENGLLVMRRKDFDAAWKMI